MKKILTIALVLLSAAGYSQLTGGTLLPTGKYQGFNKAGVIQTGQSPLDGKFSYYDTVNFVSRPFISIAEANAFLPIAQRSLGMRVYINTGGTVNSGSAVTISGITYQKGEIIGGSNNDYKYRNNRTNAGLVLDQLTAGEGIVIDTVNNVITSTGVGAVAFSVDTTYARGATHIALWGNSLAYGTGGTPTTDNSGGTPWSDYLRIQTGYDIYNYGVPGETSTQIKTRFLAAPTKWAWGQIFEMGTNNSGDTTTVIADVTRIKFVMDSIGNTRYLFTNIPGGSSSTYWSGTSTYTLLQALNSRIAAIVGASHYVDVRSALVAAYNSGNSQDVADHGHDIPPTSLMAPSDIIHYNDAGYRVWANTVALKIGIEKPTTDQKTVGTASLLDIFKNAPPIKTPLSISKIATVGFTTQPQTIYYDANGIANPIRFSVNGSVSFWNNTAASGQEGGLVIRPHLNNDGSYANLSLMGTNTSVWTSTYQGFIVKNNIRRFDMGSDFNLSGDFTHTGNLSTSGTGTFGGVVVAPQLTNAPFFTPLRIIDVSASNGGIRIPRLSQTAMDAVGGGSPYGGGQPLIGEIAFNTTKNRYEAGFISPSTTPYAKWGTIAFAEDLDFGKVVSGAGIGVSGNGSTATPYEIRRLDLPSPGLLNGTIFGTAPDAGSPTNTYDKAYDSSGASRNISTEWRGAATNGANANGIGVATSTVLTKLIFYPGAGLASNWNGAKIQGSNTSSTAGYTDLYTFSAAPPDFQYSTVNLAGTNSYKFFRIYVAASRLDAADLQFYGYVDTSGLYPKLTMSTDSLNHYLTRYNGTRDTVYNKRVSGGSGGSGTVTSVGLSLPSFITVSGSPVTTTGTLTGTLATQSANTFFAGATSGGAAAPAFRGIVSADIPSSAALAGAPTTTTATAKDSSTKVATTAYVDGALSKGVVTYRNAGGGAAFLRSVVASTDTTKITYRTITIDHGPITALYSTDDSSIALGWGHSRNATPTFSISNAGTSPTYTVTGNDVMGVVSITTGSSGTFGLMVATLTFNSAYSSAPNVIISPASAVTAAAQPFAFSSTSDFNIGTNVVLTASTTYRFYYYIGQ